MRYLDGLRGLAAVQVVGYHYALTFLPAAAGSGFLSFPTSGFLAVCLFFLLSGLVLTYSFERTPFAVGVSAVRRIVRLGVPLSIAALIGGAAVSTAPDLGMAAARLAHSPWMNSLYTGPHDLRHILADATDFTLLVGYKTTSIFGWLQPFLPVHEDSTNQPLWSLHVELWGSFLVLALVYARARSRPAYGGALVAAALLVGSHPLGLFIIGHVAAVLLGHPSAKAIRERRWTAAIGVCLLLAGVTVGTHAKVPIVYGLQRLMSYGSILPTQAPGTALPGAVLIFLGVLLASPVQALLRARPIQLLGRLSFPIYLLHWPVMLTVSSAVFVAALQRTGQVSAALLALVAGGAVTLGLAELFERYVDARAVALSHRLRARSSAAMLAE